jgi:hypothetical protein
MIDAEFDRENHNLNHTIAIEKRLKLRDVIIDPQTKLNGPIDRIIDKKILLLFFLNIFLNLCKIIQTHHSKNEERIILYLHMIVSSIKNFKFRQLTIGCLF